MPKGLAFFLKAQTSLHAGAGTAVGAIDLPIQRERHTGWPVVQGSGLKGVLRHHAKPLGANDSEIVEIFGPETDNASDHAGAVSLTDARILLFPVRSAKGVFAWVTCPAVLKRLKTDLKMIGLEPKWTAPSVPDDGAVLPTNSVLKLQSQNSCWLVLEEFRLKVTEVTKDFDADPIGNWLNEYIPEATEVAKQLAIISDGCFDHLAHFATQIETRIALNYETKTVKGTALFNQECLPPETVLYSLALTKGSRKPADDSGRRLTADQIVGKLCGWFDGKLLQIGGDETTGKGFCWVKTVQEVGS